jgi:hypothetical protein
VPVLDGPSSLWTCEIPPPVDGACPIVAVTLWMSAGVTGKAVSAPTIDRSRVTSGKNAPYALGSSTANRPARRKAPRHSQCLRLQRRNCMNFGDLGPRQTGDSVAASGRSGVGTSQHWTLRALAGIAPSRTPQAGAVTRRHRSTSPQCDVHTHQNVRSFPSARPRTSCGMKERRPALIGVCNARGRAKGDRK